jgi:Arc/MetJ-type ribon-helix-helix transcriptional regulator
VTIEIKPEVKAAIDRRLQNGRFHDVDELLTKALEALPENNEPALAPPRPNLADFLLRLSVGWRRTQSGAAKRIPLSA